MEELPRDENLHEKREKLKENTGLAFCTKQKDGSFATLESHIELAGELGLPSVQFDFRNRSFEEISTALEALIEYRRLHQDINFSIHGDVSQIDASDLSIKNQDRTRSELSFLRELAGESYTIHPPSIGSRIFKDLPHESQEAILGNYCKIFAGEIREAFEAHSQFSIAIENMPTKGDEGSWGQTSEDILLLLEKIKQALTDLGMESDEAKKYLGVTLDINHALHGAEAEKYAEILEKWFTDIGDYLKVIHVYAPSHTEKEFLEKYTTTLNLAARFCPEAHILIESKQDAEATSKAYHSLQEII